VTCPETAPNGGRVVAAISEHTVRPLPRSPASPCSRGIASINARASRESFRFAPVRRTASGTPRPSQIRWRLRPRLARSVGFRPVCCPPNTARTEQLSTPRGGLSGDESAVILVLLASGLPAPRPVLLHAIADRLARRRGYLMEAGDPMELVKHGVRSRDGRSGLRLVIGALTA
jgi:hypothetical protein